jgi:hypothetical protein
MDGSDVERLVSSGGLLWKLLEVVILISCILLICPLDLCFM